MKSKDSEKIEKLNPVQRLERTLGRENYYQESTRICPGCKVERDFVDNVNGLTTTCKSCRGTWDAFDDMFATKG